MCDVYLYKMLLMQKLNIYTAWTKGSSFIASGKNNSKNHMAQILWTCLPTAVKKIIFKDLLCFKSLIYTHTYIYLLLLLLMISTSSVACSYSLLKYSLWLTKVIRMKQSKVFWTVIENFKITVIYFLTWSQKNCELYKLYRKCCEICQTCVKRHEKSQKLGIFCNALMCRASGNKMSALEKRVQVYEIMMAEWKKRENISCTFGK